MQILVILESLEDVAGARAEMAGVRKFSHGFVD